MSIKKWFPVLLSLVSLTGLAEAQRGALEQRPPRPRVERQARNHQNGQEARGGARERDHQKLLERCDKDGDGKLSESEREARRKARGGRRPAPKKLVDRFDIDKDGKLNETEREALRQARAERRDGKDARGSGQRRGEGEGGARRRGDRG